MNRPLIDQYEKSLAPHLPKVQRALEARLRSLIAENKIKIHSLEDRTKSLSSLEKKLARPDRSYRKLSDVTDLIGFRIVTYSEDVISDVAQAIEKSFDVDFEHSINKLHQDDSEKFGYRSLHYVCALPPEAQIQIPDLDPDFRFEIQIRTALQHTWAEIEHDIGYKAAQQLPRELRRRFSQIASLLEVADREFAAIRTDLKDYESKLKSANFREEPVELDHLSLQSILDRPEIALLDRIISEHLKQPVAPSVFYPDYTLKALQVAGLKNVNDVLQSATRLQTSLARFLPAYFEFATKFWQLNVSQVEKGYGLLFLAHLHLLSSEQLFIDKLNRLTRFYSELDYPNDEAAAKSTAQALIATLKNGKFIQE